MEGRNRKNKPWTEEEEIALLTGVSKYDVGRWKKILKDPELADKLVNRTNVDLKDKWRQIERIESASIVSNESSSPNSSSDMSNESSRYDDSMDFEAISVSSDENGSEIKEKTETLTLESVSISSNSSSEDINNESSRYDSMVFEALSTINDEYGSRFSEILSFIQQRHEDEVPQNFRELLISRLAILVSQDKLKKVRNSYKISGMKTTNQKLTLHPKDSVNPPPELPSTCVILTRSKESEEIDSVNPPELQSTCVILTRSKEAEEIDAAANRIAQGINKFKKDAKILYEVRQDRELLSECLQILVSKGKLEKVLDGYTIAELVNKVLEEAPEVVAKKVAEAENERFIAVEAIEEAVRLVEESETMFQLSLEIQKLCNLNS